MKKIFCLLVILSLAGAVNMVVRASDGTSVFSSPQLAAKMNTNANSIALNGILTIPMFPEIKVGGAPIPRNTPQESKFSAGGEIGSYVVSYPEGFANEVFAAVEISISDSYISQAITLENSGEKDLTVEVQVLPMDEGTYYIFAPYKRDDNANYLWISSELGGERGEGIVISFDRERPTFDQPQEINVKNNFIRVLAWNVPLSAGETKTLGMKYFPGYAIDESLMEGNPYSPSLSKQYLLHTQSEALFEIGGEGATDSIKPGIDAAATGTDALQAFKKTLDSIPDTATSEAILTSLAVDLNDALQKTTLNSIEKSLMFREMSRRQGLPSEIHLGYRDGNYYAWAVSYLGTSRFAYDPAGKMSDYKQVYSEPEPLSCRGELHGCPWAQGIRKDLFCVGPVCISAYIVIFLFILIAAAAFAVFHYKTEMIYTIMGIQRGGNLLGSDNLEGSYDIVNEKFLPKDPVEQTVWNALRRRSGSFKAEDYVAETGFSEVLVKSAIEKMVENGIIKRHF